jgi:hypothetical protein
MKCIRSAILVTLATLAASTAMAAAKSPFTKSSADGWIPFANHGGIRDWRDDGDRGMWVQGSDRHWFYATFMSPCIGLPFAQSVGFVTGPSGELDKWSSVLVRGELRCVIQTFTPSDGPPKRAPAKAS